MPLSLLSLCSFFYSSFPFIYFPKISIPFLVSSYPLCIYLCFHHQVYFLCFLFLSPLYPFLRLFIPSHSFQSIYYFPSSHPSNCLILVLLIQDPEPVSVTLGVNWEYPPDVMLVYSVAPHRQTFTRDRGTMIVLAKSPTGMVLECEGEKKVHQLNLATIIPVSKLGKV